MLVYSKTSQRNCANGGISIDKHQLSHLSLITIAASYFCTLHRPLLNLSQILVTAGDFFNRHSLLFLTRPQKLARDKAGKASECAVEGGAGQWLRAEHEGSKRGVGGAERWRWGEKWGGGLNIQRRKKKEKENCKK